MRTREQQESLAAMLDEKNRRRAKVDPAFFINNYLMTFDPRPDVIPHDIPFELYPFQEDAVHTIVKNIREATEAILELLDE